jgi:recombination protein RecR
MDYPKSIKNLIEAFKEFPTVGPKTAERYVFYLLKQSPEKLQILAQYIAELREKNVYCKECMSISETDPCLICKNKNRDKTKLCITANSQDMLLIESTKQFYGYYFILGGLLDLINEIKPENINIELLKEKIKKQKPKEIILALDPTLNGETTSMYIAKILKNTNIKITKLARGLPSGANLEYADQLTLSNALKNRK